MFCHVSTKSPFNASSGRDLVAIAITINATIANTRLYKYTPNEWAVTYYTALSCLLYTNIARDWRCAVSNRSWSYFDASIYVRVESSESQIIASNQWTDVRKCWFDPDARFVSHGLHVTYSSLFAKPTSYWLIDIQFHRCHVKRLNSADYIYNA